MPFKDRSDAGRQLAKALTGYKDERPIILALPRGGVPVAGEVAAVLSAPVDLILVRKIGVPWQPELAGPTEGHEASARLQDVDLDLPKVPERTRAQESRW